MQKWKRALAGVLATLLVLQCAPYTVLAAATEPVALPAPTASTAVSEASERTDVPDAAAETDTEPTAAPTAEPTAAPTAEPTAAPTAEPADNNAVPAVLAQTAPLAEGAQLQDGTAFIPAGANEATVKQLLFDALVINKEGLDPQDLDWEYYCTGKSSIWTTNDAWGSVNGFTSKKGIITYTHPALANNEDGSYQVRLKGSEAEVTLTKVAKLASSITLNEGVSVALPYTAEAAVDYDTLRQNLFAALVASSIPALTADDVTITYYAEAKSGSVGDWGHAWVPLEGGKDGLLTYPAISAGTQQIRIFWPGNQQYASATVEATVEVADREQLQFTLKDAPYEVGLVFNDEQGYDYTATAAAIYSAVVDSTSPLALTADDVTVEYNVDKTGITDSFKPLDQSDATGLVKFGTGTWEIRISWAGSQQYAPATIEATVSVMDRSEAPYTLKETPDTVVLAVDENLNVDYDAVRDAIFNAVVASSDVLTADNVTITYYTKALTDVDAKYVALEGEKGTVLTWPAISAGEQKIQISWPGSQQYAPTTIEATVSVADRSQAPYTLKETPDTVVLKVDENLNVDYDAVRNAIFNAVVASSDVLTADNVTITYYTKALTDADAKYVALEGEKGTVLTWPAISAGEQKIQISWPGSQQYAPTTIEATVSVTDRPAAEIELGEAPAVKLAVTEDLQLDIEKLYADVFGAVIASSTPALTVDDVTITYYAEAKSGSVGDWGHAWVPLEGGKDGLLTYPAISAGTQQIRIYWPGNQQYAPTTVEATVEVADREQLQFTLKDAPYEVGLVFNDEQGYDYTATAAAIYSAVVDSTSPLALTADDVTVEYNVDKTGITDSFKPLDQSDATGLVKFGTGTWEIRISWAGNREYRGNSVTVQVTATDNRLASAVALKDGVSFTYNMDPTVMKQAIFDNLIDWDNSTLPARETLTVDDFVIEYKAKLTDIESGVDLGLGDLDDWISSDALTQWVPIEGKIYQVGGTVLGQYPAMGAGEAQAIRIQFRGNADYRPSENAEGTVTVNKANVTVTVHSTNIYADESLPADFITMDPADKFDVYTIYAGLTSNVTTGIYLDLPDRYTNSVFLKALDPVVQAIYGKSFTQMLNDGVTVGELRQLFSTQEILDLLDKLNIDTGTFGQILSVINNLPSVADSLRISFGTPNRAGLYTVAAVTDSQNYNTGVGIGFLLVKMRLSGTKLTWNQEISGKLTAAQAKEFDFGATLSYNGDVTISQSGVHYLYSGFTSKWRIYSSTTTPPTEPGSYVMTVCILGGNHFALPITRTFTITK